MKYNYVYRITNKKENKHYYGVRTSKCIPELDLGIKYFSSSSDKDFLNEQKVNNYIFKYKVIKIFETREEAINLEIKLHNKFNVGINKSFYNMSKQTTNKFDTTGIKLKSVNYRINKTLMNYKKIQKYIPNEQIENYILNGWLIGGIPLTEEQCKNISKGKKGKPAHNKGIPCSDEQKNKISLTKTGIKLSDDIKKKMSLSHIGLKGTITNTKKINNGIIEKFIKKNEVETYIINGWTLGRLNKEKCMSVKNKIAVNNGIISKFIDKLDLPTYETNGWIKGFKKKS